MKYYGSNSVVSFMLAHGMVSNITKRFLELDLVKSAVCYPIYAQVLLDEKKSN
jgi:hypothetical protein